MTRLFFIVGNKRSGTSQLVRLLNLHPQVFISHESDIVWILYQFHRGQPFAAHPWDSDKGMRLTLEACRSLLRPDRSPWENFLAAQRRLMERGTPWLPPMRKTELSWLGDKKPFQQLDPRLLPFIREHFPDARFLHITRHPFAVVASSDRFNQSRDGDFWMDLAPEEKLERWAFHEQQVQALRETIEDRVHSFRYEDLCPEPRRELAGVFRFLDLTFDTALLEEAARRTLPAANVLPAIPYSSDARRMASDYGYRLQRSFQRVRTLSESIQSWAIRRRQPS